MMRKRVINTLAAILAHIIAYLGVALLAVVGVAYLFASHNMPAPLSVQILVYLVAGDICLKMLDRLTKGAVLRGVGRSSLTFFDCLLARRRRKLAAKRGPSGSKDQHIEAGVDAGMEEA